MIFVLLSFSTSEPACIKMTDNDQGRTVELRIGESLEVELRANPTTGYAWDIASLDEEILKQVGETEFKQEREGRGVGGKIMMRFKARAAGETPLKLIYHRRFENERPPIKTFEVTITVK